LLPILPSNAKGFYGLNISPDRLTAFFQKVIRLSPGQLVRVRGFTPIRPELGTYQAHSAARDMPHPTREAGGATSTNFENGPEKNGVRG
jgi:hypothetical protein